MAAIGETHIGGAGSVRLSIPVQNNVTIGRKFELTVDHIKQTRIASYRSTIAQIDRGSGIFNLNRIATGFHPSATERGRYWTALRIKFQGYGVCAGGTDAASGHRQGTGSIEAGADTGGPYAKISPIQNHSAGAIGINAPAIGSGGHAGVHHLQEGRCNCPKHVCTDAVITKGERRTIDQYAWPVDNARPSYRGVSINARTEVAGIEGRCAHVQLGFTNHQCAHCGPAETDSTAQING
ncbi:hypothetical protein D3C71_438590 [compost metagenome]